MYHQGSQAYAKISLESQLAGATPHQLIAMLFDGAHSALLRAKIYFEENNIAKRGEMISKAINIVDNGLRSSLDHEKGQQIAADLDRLYDYISRLLMQANLHNDVSKLEEADKLLTDIADVWDEIAPHKQAGQR
ncbi:flagellar export chaperone FliS [Candidatus Pantoea deserta]|uniref:Flagellar secretion chaperone FliS n=1 Tax=Candidatus Pantoea deserta TaxID=1869313 RepID=A0A3N4P8N1_9GAMM|nr:flagellar export chaperone FliS [Pantoea deserta]RPE04626.1 flagellar export chaperone FliS [Pantoea deserta]